MAKEKWVNKLKKKKTIKQPPDPGAYPVGGGSAMSGMKLEQLFNRFVFAGCDFRPPKIPQYLHVSTCIFRCDTHGKGYIDLEEFRDLCGSFEIGRDDADVIFADLDHDGDGRISFEDFSYGFRDFLTPGSRRGSVQLGLSASPAAAAPVRQPSFRQAWSRVRYPLQKK